MTRRSLLALAAAAIAALPLGARAQDDHKPIKMLIITGDEVGAHKWQETTEVLRSALSRDGHIQIDVTATPAKDLTAENLAKYDVLMLNYRETSPTPDTKWSDANKAAFLDAVKGGKGLVVVHFASSGFNDWPEFETAIGGGWRKQGFHGPSHVFTVKKTDADHPISKDLPASFEHVIDELYSNSVMVPGNTVLATAYCDPSKPRGTGKDEPIVWVREYGKGRVYHNVLGHTAEAMGDPSYQEWMRRGVEWAATGEVCPTPAKK
jgi:type 1 glutamine amidotransferase